MNTRSLLVGCCAMAMTIGVYAAQRSSYVQVTPRLQDFLKTAKAADLRQFAEAMFAEYLPMFVDADVSHAASLPLLTAAQIAESVTTRRSSDKKMQQFIADITASATTNGKIDLGAIARFFKTVVEKINPATERYFPSTESQSFIATKKSNRIPMSPDLFM